MWRWVYKAILRWLSRLRVRRETKAEEIHGKCMAVGNRSPWVIENLIFTSPVSSDKSSSLEGNILFTDYRRFQGWLPAPQRSIPRFWGVTAEPACIVQSPLVVKKVCSECLIRELSHCFIRSSLPDCTELHCALAWTVKGGHHSADLENYLWISESRYACTVLMQPYSGSFHANEECK